MIRRWRHQLMIAACGGLGFWSGGCTSSTTTSSTAEATVHGTVKLKGKLVTSGTIFFNPANINRKEVAAVTAPIGKDGTYTIKTLVGSNKVSVSTPATIKDPILQYNMIQHRVTAGDNTFDIEVTPP